MTDNIARALAATAIDMIQQQGGRYIGDTPLAAGQEQGQLNNFVKNETGGNPISGDEVADTNTGNIWRFDGNTWKISSFNPDHAQVMQNKADIANLRNRVTKNEQDIIQINADLTQEKVDRKNKDDDLQDQIDALQALAKGVREVVGTYAEMEQLDKTTLVDGDIINILADETRDSINAYYRFNQATQQYDYIGSISPYYTKAQIDTKEDALKDLINAKQDKLVTVDDSIELTPNPADGTVTIKAKLNGVLSDTPVEDGDKFFSDGGAYKLAPTLNGQKVLENPTFFAPTILGDEGQIISVDANGQLVWIDNEGGGGDIKKITINNIEQPLDPIDKICSIDTDDTLIETPQTNLLSVAKANIPITKAEYEALTQVEREDETKVYLITDDVTDTPVAISEIDDRDDTKLSENFTRSNKYITQQIEAPLSMVRDWKVGSTIMFNGDAYPFHDYVNFSFYAPTTAGQTGDAVIMGDDGLPTWGSASKVTLNGVETKDASFYAPTTAGATGQIVVMGTNGAPVWSNRTTITLNGAEVANPTFYAPTVAGAAGQMVVMGTNGRPTWENKTVVTLNGTTTKTPSFYAAPTSTSADSGLMLRSRGANLAPIWTCPRIASMSGTFSTFSISTSSNNYQNLSSASVYSNFTINNAAIFNAGASIINVPGAYLFIFNGRQTRSNSSGWTTYYYRIAPTDGSTVSIGQIYQSDFSGTRTCIAASTVITISKPSYVSIYVSNTADHTVSVDGYGRYIYLGTTS